jgi:hypothetical protein
MTRSDLRPAVAGTRFANPGRTRVSRAAGPVVALGVLVALLSAGGTAARAADAYFVPEASGVTWDGEALTVTFREVGVEPGTTTTVAVEATGTVESVCRQADEVVVSTTSSATVTDVADHPADPDATVTALRDLALIVQPPTIVGLPCTVEITRTVTVTLHDLDTGAVLVVTGPTGPAGAPG